CGPGGRVTSGGGPAAPEVKERNINCPCAGLQRAPGTSARRGRYTPCRPPAFPTMSPNRLHTPRLAPAFWLLAAFAFFASGCYTQLGADGDYSARQTTGYRLPADHAQQAARPAPAIAEPAPASARVGLGYEAEEAYAEDVYAEDGYYEDDGYYAEEDEVAVTRYYYDEEVYEGDYYGGYYDYYRPYDVGYHHYYFPRRWHWHQLYSPYYLPPAWAYAYDPFFDFGFRYGWGWGWRFGVSFSFGAPYYYHNPSFYDPFYYDPFVGYYYAYSP